MGMDREAFNENFLRKLKLLELVARKVLKGKGLGKNPGGRRGGEVIFRDYHRYTPGEEYRYIDWNIYSRLERLFVKEFSREEEIPVAVLVDQSRSMDYGFPSKSMVALRLAAALSYIALAGKNRLSVGLAGGEGLQMKGPFFSHRAFFKVMEFLSASEPRGWIENHAVLSAFHERTRESSLVIFISDLLDEGEGRGAFGLLNARGHDLSLIHLLCREEMHPPFRGEVRLEDMELGEKGDFFLSEDQLGRYAERLHVFLKGWQDFARRHQIRYILCRTDEPVEELIMTFLRRGGFLR